MPFFNFRRAPAPAAAGGAAVQPESVEAMRKRAKHRLIGAVVLVLLGVVGFPLLFDTQPRPVAVDIPIEIPAKNGVKPLVSPSARLATASVLPAAASPAASPVVSVAPAASLTPREEIITEKKAEAPAKAAPVVTKNEATSESVVDAKSPVRAPAAAAGDDGARANALLNGKPATAASAAKATPVEGAERLVVQVGAFADADMAQDVRQKLERAGLKTYTQVAETKEGKRIRVRVGPFASKAEADKAASKIKSLDLPAAVLTL